MNTQLCFTFLFGGEDKGKLLLDIKILGKISILFQSSSQKINTKPKKIKIQYYTFAYGNSKKISLNKKKESKYHS